MIGEILDGIQLAEMLRKNLSEKIKNTMAQHQQQSASIPIQPPTLVAILVGNNPASLVYIKQKENACLEVGINFQLIHMPEDVVTGDVVSTITSVNNNNNIHGCLVQLPLPNHIDTDMVINSMDVRKDVDCFHAENIGRLALNNPRFVPATPLGIQLLLEYYKVETRGKHCVIIGKSLIVGQPLMNLMSLENGMAATVTCCDKWTENLANYTRTADILIVAAGVHHLINNPETVKPGAVVIDVGIHRIHDENKKNGYRLEGDVDFQTIRQICRYITPVPGGVGPMTVVSLLLNTWTAYEESQLNLSNLNA